MLLSVCLEAKAIFKVGPGIHDILTIHGREKLDAIPTTIIDYLLVSRIYESSIYLIPCNINIDF